MKTKCMSCGGSMKKMQKGGPIKYKPLSPKPKPKTGMDALKALYEHVTTFGGATKKDDPKQKDINIVKKLKETFSSTKKPMKKMAVGGTTTKRIIKKSTGGMYGIPQENLGTSGQYGFAKKGGATKKYQKGGNIIKAIKKVVKKITRPTLRKAQNGIEMDDNMMINKPGYSGGYSNGAVSKVPVTPVRPRIGNNSDYNSPGKSGRPDSYERSKLGRPSMGKPTVEKWLEAKKKYKYVEPTSREKPVSGYKKGGATKAAKFAALAPPYNKATYADRIVGAKKNAKKKK